LAREWKGDDTENELSYMVENQRDLIIFAYALSSSGSIAERAVMGFAGRRANPIRKIGQASD
jgi:hypothetical protein